MKKIVFLTGAGMSVESGLSTFRGAGGMWDEYPVEKVASIDGYIENPALVLEFYNKRRKELLNVKPNDGHKLIAALEESYEVVVVTQNVDDLHERAGSTNVIHLHGELIIVWFGEAVPMMDDAIAALRNADIFIIIGTSLNVYPAAGLLNYAPARIPIYLIDPNEVNVSSSPRLTIIRKGASEGMREVTELIKD